MQTLKDVKCGQSVSVVKLHGEGAVSYTHLRQSAYAVL